MQESTYTELEVLFLALGDKTRLKLLALMADGPVAVGFLTERLNESQPKVSRHLAYLRNSGVVTTRRDGKWIYYAIDYPADMARRRILDTVVHSIAVTRVDGKDVKILETVTLGEEATQLGNETYAEAYVSEVGDNSREDDKETVSEVASDRDEIDVFLL